MSAGSSVLLVGDFGPQMEPELAANGYPCALSPNANDAVARMRQQRFSVVVVPPYLPDMPGVEFVQGVLRHFDSNAVVIGNGVDLGEMDALMRTGRAVHLPQADTYSVLDLLQKAVPRQAPVMPSFPSPHSGGYPNMAAPQIAAPQSGGYDLSQPAFDTGFTPGGAFGLGQAPYEQGLPPGIPASALPQNNMYPPQGAMFGSVPQAGFSVGQMPAAQQFPGGGGGNFGFSPMGMPMPQTPVPPVSTNFGGGSGGSINAGMGAPADDGRLRGEVLSLQQRLAQAEQERAALLVEIEAARRSAISHVADVMALSGEGNIASELEDAQHQLKDAEAAVQLTQTELAQLRLEREDLASQLKTAQSGAKEVKELRAERDAQTTRIGELSSAVLDAKNRLAEVERQMLARDAQIADAAKHALADAEIAEQLREELERTRSDATAAMGRVRALEDTVAALSAERQDLTQAATAPPALADAEREVGRLSAALAATRTDAQALRLDHQETSSKLEELQNLLNDALAESEALRAEAEPLRAWGEQVVQAHAQQQKALEKLRVDVETWMHRASVAEENATRLERAAQNAPAHHGNASDAAAVERARKLAGLVGALEPFMWGLKNATQFYGKNRVDGSDEHVRLLMQLQGVLFRLKDEIAALHLDG